MLPGKYIILITKKRMRIVFLLLCVCAFGTFIGSQVMKTSTAVDGVLLQNVEALASAESNLPTYCEFSGDCTCPIGGIKVKYVIERYNVESDEETY